MNDHVLITGGSRGIGAATVLSLPAPGTMLPLPGTAAKMLPWMLCSRHRR